MNNHALNNLASIGNTISNTGANALDSIIGYKQGKRHVDKSVEALGKYYDEKLAIQNDEYNRRLEMEQNNYDEKLRQSAMLGSANNFVSVFSKNLDNYLTEYASGFEKTNVSGFSNGVDENVWEKCLNDTKAAFGDKIDADSLDLAGRLIDEKVRPSYEMAKLEKDRALQKTAVEAEFASQMADLLTFTDEDGNWAFFSVSEDDDATSSAVETAKLMKNAWESEISGENSMFSPLNIHGDYDSNGEIARNFISTVGISQYTNIYVAENALKGSMLTSADAVSEFGEWAKPFLSELGYTDSQIANMMPRIESEFRTSFENRKNMLASDAAQARISADSNFTQYMRDNGISDPSKVSFNDYYAYYEQFFSDWNTNAYSKEMFASAIKEKAGSFISLYDSTLGTITSGIASDPSAFGINMERISSNIRLNGSGESVMYSSDMSENFDSFNGTPFEMDILSKVNELTGVESGNFQYNVVLPKEVAEEVERICAEYGITDSYGKCAIAMTLGSMYAKANDANGDSVAKVAQIENILNDKMYEPETKISFVEQMYGLGHISKPTRDLYLYQIQYESANNSYGDVVRDLKARGVAEGVFDIMSMKKYILDSMMEHTGEVDDDFMRGLASNINGMFYTDMADRVLDNLYGISVSSDEEYSVKLSGVLSSTTSSEVLSRYLSGELDALGIGSSVSELIVQIDSLMAKNRNYDDTNQIQIFSSSDFDDLVVSAWNMLGYDPSMVDKLDKYKDDIRYKTAKTTAYVALSKFVADRALSINVGESLDTGMFNAMTTNYNINGATGECMVSEDGIVVLNSYANGNTSYSVAVLSEEGKRAFNNGTSPTLTAQMFDFSVALKSFDTVNTVESVSEVVEHLNNSFRMGMKDYRASISETNDLQIERYDMDSDSWVTVRSSEYPEEVKRNIELVTRDRTLKVEKLQDNADFIKYLNDIRVSKLPNTSNTTNGTQYTPLRRPNGMMFDSTML